MSDAHASLFRWQDVPREALGPRLARQVITGERMMLAQLHLDEGATVPTHSHENEQLTYVLEGLLRFWLGADESQVVDVGAGEGGGRLPPAATGLARRQRRLLARALRP